MDGPLSDALLPDALLMQRIGGGVEGVAARGCAVVDTGYGDHSLAYLGRIHGTLVGLVQGGEHPMQIG